MFFFSSLAKPTLHFFGAYNVLEDDAWEIAQLEIPSDRVEPNQECPKKSIKRFVLVRKDDSGSIWNRSIGFIPAFINSFFEYKVETVQGIFCLKKASLYRSENMQLQLEERISRIFFDSIPQVCLHADYLVNDPESNYNSREKKLLNSLKNNDVQSLQDVVASYMQEDDWISYFHEILFLAQTTKSVSCLQGAINSLIENVELNLEVALKKSHLSGFIVDADHPLHDLRSAPVLDPQLGILSRMHSFFSGVGLPSFIREFIKKNLNAGIIPLFLTSPKFGNLSNSEQEPIEETKLNGDIDSALARIRQIEAHLFSRKHEINQMIREQGVAVIEVEDTHAVSDEVTLCRIDSNKIDLMLQKK